MFASTMSAVITRIAGKRWRIRESTTRDIVVESIHAERVDLSQYGLRRP
jgi:hypothetical protein